MDTTILLIAGWLAQAVVFGLAGEQRKCGFSGGLFASLIGGPFAALAIIIMSQPRPLEK